MFNVANVHLRFYSIGTGFLFRKPFFRNDLYEMDIDSAHRGNRPGGEIAVQAFRATEWQGPRSSEITFTR